MYIDISFDIVAKKPKRRIIDHRTLFVGVTHLVSPQMLIEIEVEEAK